MMIRGLREQIQQPEETLTDHDIDVLGRPSIRLDIPLLISADQMGKIADDLELLAREFHKAAQPEGRSLRDRLMLVKGVGGVVQRRFTKMREKRSYRKMEFND